MRLKDEVNNTNVFHIDSEEYIIALHKIKKDKMEEIKSLQKKIEKYEGKRRQKEAMYQALPLFKKLFTSHPPDHHQAVEYMVYVKARLKSITKLKQSIAQLDKLISDAYSNRSKQEMHLSRILLEEIKAWKEAEVYEK